MASLAISLKRDAAQPALRSPRAGAGHRNSDTKPRSVRALACAAFALPFLLVSTVAPVSATEELRTEGATIRLVAEAPSPDGLVRGAVFVDLAPSWKTYWLDPGPSGLAPRLDFTRSSAIGDVTATLPAPTRQGSGPAEMIGYDAPVAFAFTAAAEPGAEPLVRLDLLVGICRDLCVPVAGTLEADGRGVLSPEDAAAIDRAFLALPRRSDERAQAQWTASEIRITALPVPDAEALFVEPVEGWRFGAARREGEAWLVPLLARPPADAAHPPLRVLATGGERNPRGTRVDIR